MKLFQFEILGVPVVRKAQSHAAEAGRTEESNKLQADTAHTPPIQRSDEGRAQGETAGEGKES